MNSKVDTYILKQQSPQREICQRLRDIIFTTFPDIQEEFKLGVPWYEDKFYIVALKDHVNIGFSLKGLTKEQSILLQGYGKTMKVKQYATIDEIDEKELILLLKMVAKSLEKS